MYFKALAGAKIMLNSFIHTSTFGAFAYFTAQLGIDRGDIYHIVYWIKFLYWWRNIELQQMVSMTEIWPLRRNCKIHQTWFTISHYLVKVVILILILKTNVSLRRLVPADRTSPTFRNSWICFWDKEKDLWRTWLKISKKIDISLCQRIGFDL